MSFIKLKNKLHVNDYTIKSLIVSYGTRLDDNTFKGISYSNIEVANNDEIFNLIPDRFKKYFMIGIMEVTHKIPPHTDSNVLSTINIYINTDNCLTQFYKFKDQVVEKSQLENQTTGFLFKTEDLNPTDNFVAEPNDAYLLNVSLPHAVIPQEELPIHRIAVVLQSGKFSFDEVLEMLKETGNV
jgi:hypothetical protein